MNDKVSTHMEKVAKDFHGHEAIEQLIIYTMNNFAYRYFVSPNEITTEKIADNIYEARFVDNNIKQALKIKNQQARDLIVKLVQEVPLKEAHLAWVIQTKICELHGDKGDIEVRAIVNCNYPAHELGVNEHVISKKIHFDDPMDFRNTFANHLESVCELFL